MSNTFVSDPNAPAPSQPGTPGGGAPGAQMGITAAVGWLLVGSAGIGLTTAYLARKGAGKPQMGVLDVFATVYNASTIAVVFGTAKLLAYRYHGHKLSQAVLLIL